MSLRARTRALLAGATAALVAAVTLAVAGGSASAAPPAPTGVTKADEIAYLKGLAGNHVLSGQQGGANSNPSQWISKVHDITGKPMCSKEAGGGAARDATGNVKCLGGCEEATRERCEAGK